MGLKIGFSKKNADRFYLPGQEVKISCGLTHKTYTTESDNVLICRQRIIFSLCCFVLAYIILCARVSYVCLSKGINIDTAIASEQLAEEEFLHLKNPVKRADILEAEGQRQSEILQAEGSKQAAILEAEGKKEAAFREAEARERSAEAEARATLMVSEAIAKGDAKALTYFLGQKYIEALQGIVTSPNEKLLMLPVDTAQVMSTVASIGELVKDIAPAAGKNKKSA